MSVRKNEQSTSSFNTLDAILKLVSHTCNILSNEKVFIPRYQKFIDSMAEETCRIYHNCRVANKIDMRTSNKVEYAEKKIKRMINLVDKGERTKHDVDVYFKCWKASLRFGNTHKLIENLNKWYLEQWKGAD